FTRSDGNFRISKNVRDLCVFARQDLTRDPPFSRLDLIICRNVLIYLGAPLQRKLLNVFHYALKPGGFLMLGQAENPSADSDGFSVFNKKQSIFRSAPKASRSDAVVFATHFVDPPTAAAERKMTAVNRPASSV